MTGMPDTPASLPLLCALCLYSDTDVAAAVTVIEGTAVCHDHTGHAHGPRFAEALQRARGHDSQADQFEIAIRPDTPR